MLGTVWSTRRGATLTSRQYILDSGLARAGLPGATGASLPGELRSLIRRCRSQGRVLVGWSTHEVSKVCEYAPRVAADFDALYRDAKSVAKLWRSKLHQELPLGRTDRQPTHRLTVYADWTSCLIENGEKRIGETLARLGSAAGAGKTYEDLSEPLRERWDELLKQNLDDCLMTRCVALRVLRELRPGDEAPETWA